ncbi:MAG: OFA family MFS transporter [Anaerolineae bacterium]|nr:OFA family MFS transporter [Anaerolineae bacterium]
MDKSARQGNKGWLVVVAGTCALLALGVLYAWSVVKAAIPTEWGWAEAQKTLPYSIACVVFSVMTPVGARLLSRFGPRIVISLGGLLAGLGMIISSQSSSPWIYSIAFGGLLGTGIGFVYASASPTALRWFPASKTGMISGIVVAGFGLGSAWVAPLSRSLIAAIGLQSTLLYLGVGMLIVVIACAQFMQFPPADYVVADNKSVKVSNAAKKADFTPGQVVKTWQFYFMWITFAFGSGAGLMVIGNLASIVKDQIGLAAVSAVAVSALAIGNGTGRVLYGMLSDKAGRKTTLLIAFSLQAVLIYLMSFFVKDSPYANVPLLMALVALIGANYGSNLAVFPAMTKDYYGTKNFAMNFGVVYTAWGLGGFLLSQLAGSIKDMYGDFTYAYYLATAMLIVAAVMMAVLKSPQPEEKKEETLNPQQALSAD